MVGDDQVRWRVPPKVPVAKVIVAGILVLLALVTADQWWQVAVAAGAAAGLLAWAARDLVAPVRLAADGAGVTVVTRFAHRQWLAWPQVDRVRVDVRRRSRMLELDAGETLFLFSRYDLDADLDDVAARLESLRTSAS